MSATKLVEIRKVTGEIHIETGLHIGASAETMEISGIDNPILRNPVDSMPYIPGSSIKGKLRSLSEWSRGEIPTEGNVTRPNIEAASAQVFGIPAQTPRNNASEGQVRAAQRGPTRLIVRDAFLTAKSKEAFQSGKILTEVKSENSINRLTSMANPRPLERVLPGVSFQLELLYKIFDVDGDNGNTDRKNFEEVLLPALALIEADAIGGAVSRGCGKFRFVNLTSNGKSLTLPELSYFNS